MTEETITNDEKSVKNNKGIDTEKVEGSDITINNADTIENKNTFNLKLLGKEFGQVLKEKKDNEFIDFDLTTEVTYDLSSISSKGFIFAEQKQFVEKLIKERWLLITADDYDMAEHVISSLVTSIPNSEHYGYREFPPSSARFRQQEENTDKSLYTIKSFIENNHLVPKANVIVSNLTGGRHTEFNEFLTTFSKIEIMFGRLTNTLRSGNKFWLIAVPSSIKNRHFKSSYFEDRYCWRPNLLNTLIHHYHAEDEIDESELKIQIKNELWGPLPNAIAYIQYCMEENSFLEAYLKHQNKEQKPQLIENPFTQLIAKSSALHPLYRTILFILCHLPSLPPGFFEDVLRILVSNIQLKLPKNKPKTTNNDSLSIDDNTAWQATPQVQSPESMKIERSEAGAITIEISSSNTTPDEIKPDIQTDEESVAIEDTQHTFEVTEIDAFDYWQENKGDIFNACFFTARKSFDAQDRRKFIVFKEPWRKQAALNALEANNPLYFDDFFQKILESNLLFHSDDHTAAAIANLFCERMLQEPSRFDADWLSSWILTAQDYFTVEQFKIQDFDSGLEALIELLSPNKFYLYRWTGLLFKILDEPVLEKTVDNFLRSLLQHSSQSGSPQESKLLMQFIRRLRHHSRFDTLYWLKQVIANCSDDDTVKEASEFLSVYIKDNLAIEPKLIATLIDWQPEKKHKSLSKLHKVVLKIPLELCSEGFNNDDTTSIQDIPPIVDSIDNHALSTYASQILKLLTNEHLGHDEELTWSTDLIHLS